jgi:hypothetical protein
MRGGTAIGPGGGVRSWSNTRSCAGGSCTGAGTYVGPAGKTITRSGTATYDNGGWQAQGTVTGPRGGTGNYQASGSCAGGACSSSGTWTGPNGEEMETAAIITLSNEPRTHVTIGQDLELQAIAASVIGGVLMTGGRGSVIGAALGTFFLTAVRSELITLGAPPNWYISFVGFVLVFAVVVNTSIQRRMTSGSAQ